MMLRYRFNIVVCQNDTSQILSDITTYVRLWYNIPFIVHSCGPNVKHQCISLPQHKVITEILKKIAYNHFLSVKFEVSIAIPLRMGRDLLNQFCPTF